MAKPSQPQQPGVSAQRDTPGISAPMDDPDGIAATEMPYSSAVRVLRSLRDRMVALYFPGGVARASLTPGCCGWDGFAILAAKTTSSILNNDSKWYELLRSRKRERVDQADSPTYDSSFYTMDLLEVTYIFSRYNVST